MLRLPKIEIRVYSKKLITGLIISYIIYSAYEKIDQFLKEAEFYFNDPEPGFVSKLESFHLDFIHEKNSKGNLETYLRNYTQRLPVLSRNNGITIVSPEYNFLNFTSEEREYLCKGRKK